MEDGPLGQCGRIAVQILVDQDIIEEIVCVIIQLQDGEGRHVLVHLFKRINVLSLAQVNSNHKYSYQKFYYFPGPDKLYFCEFYSINIVILFLPCRWSFRSQNSDYRYDNSFTLEWTLVTLKKTQSCISKCLYDNKF